MSSSWPTFSTTHRLSRRYYFLLHSSLHERRTQGRHLISACTRLPVVDEFLQPVEQDGLALQEWVMGEE